MKKLLTITLLLLGGATFTVVAKPVTSPNGKIKVVTKEHALIVNYQGKEAQIIKTKWEKTCSI